MNDTPTIATLTSKNDSLEACLDQQNLSRLLGVSLRTLERWRQDGTGPRFSKAGRKVIYRRSAVDEWLKSREFESAAEARAAGVK